ncbi:polyketide cyclase [Sporosarcina sp. P18a]|uniref:SRPBCC family protein n=1 Tax=unclassified Sporosarcina TaxID=2647733 RepID=UPI000C166FE9|nr:MULTISPECIES: SRPBCC domain-containing protein [unclassified Sporosarcina]PIC80912.1 polyketide cyclase [Sporosarcina sp. P18a]PID01355.1 polyketide cyclase [Sporosarcina sp. P2]PID25077.1 polyketide cyclase [Sporosarcina sp. P7]
MNSQEKLEDIRKTVRLTAPLEKVWQAVSTSEGMAAWWMPNSLQPIEGQEFVLHTGQYGDSLCKVTELDPPTRLGFDWGKDWHVFIELKKLSDEETELTLIHAGWDANKVTEFEQPHAVIRGFMDSGWERIVKEKLPTVLQG